MIIILFSKRLSKILLFPLKILNTSIAEKNIWIVGFKNKSKESILSKKLVVRLWLFDIIYII